MQTAEKERIREAFVATMDYEELLNCTRCGFCLPSCPTYVETGHDEVHSPRGRIAIMKGIVDGDIEPSEEVKRSIDLCLGCRACETACPSGVKFGRLLEQAREAIYGYKKLGLGERIVRHATFKNLFPHQKRMERMTSLLSFYQRSGLQKTVRTLGILKMFPETMRSMEKVLPEAPKRKQLKNRQRHYFPFQSKHKKVAFFSGCLMDTMFRKTNDATTKLLQYAGCEIIVPKGQNCCGALHGHSGEREQARELAKRNIEAFEQANVDYIVTNAGGCGGFLVDYAYLLKNDPEWAERAETFEEKVVDISQLLYDLDFHHVSLKGDGETVTFQDSCHLKNGQKTFTEPRELLQSIENISFVDMRDADRCCGSAGIYNMLEPEMSIQVLDYKMKQAKRTNAHVIVTANPGCYLQMKLGVEREGLTEQVEVVQLVDYLLEVYERANEKVISK
ncbi:MAG TPA: (Fe-S)-binding protein [Bacillota bacterium]|nr:(Fe-S)-binding protein [Bacillota bacterium]